MCDIYVLQRNQLSENLNLEVKNESNEDMYHEHKHSGRPIYGKYITFYWQNFA